MIQSLVLLAVCLGFSACHYMRRGYLMQIGIYFNVLGVLYFVIGPTLVRSTMADQFANELDQIGLMSIVALTGFNIAYWVAGVRQTNPTNRGPGYLPSHTAMVFAVGVALAFEAAAIALIGVSEFFASDRIERFANLQARNALFYVANLINVCLPFVLARYLHFRQRRDRNLMYFIIAHGVTVGLATISRYDLSIIVLCLCYFLERHRIAGSRSLFAILILSILMTVIFKPSLYQVMLGKSYAHVLDTGEYTNWIRNTILLMTRPEVDMPHNGYQLALKSLFVVSPREDALSEWFFQEFFYERYILFPGLGYGFSGVWEGYSANGLAGVAVHFALFGACFGWLERSSTAMRQVFAVFAIILAYRLFRSEAYNFVKTYAWYFAHPAFAIVCADKFMTWATRRRTIEAGHWPQDGAPEQLRGTGVGDLPERRGRRAIQSY